MDLHLLSEVFLATLDTDLATREAAETHLRKCRSNPEMPLACLTLSISKTYFPVIQQSAAVYLKNNILKDWQKQNHYDKLPATASPNGASPTHSIPSNSNGVTYTNFSVEQKNKFRQQVLYSLHLASPEVLNHLLAIVGALIPLDFPYNWPDLVPSTLEMLQSTDSNTVYCGVLCCIEILRNFKQPSTVTEQRDANLNSIVASLFPLLYRIAASLALDSHEKAGLILWKIIKCYKLSICIEIPIFLQQDVQLKNWLCLFTGILQRPIQLEPSILESQDSVAYKFSHKPSLSTSSTSSNSSSFTSVTDSLPITPSGESSVHAWLKCKRWACFVHTKLMTVHATLNSKVSFKTSLANSSFASIYLSHFAPNLCNIFLNEISVWRSQSAQTISFLSLHQSVINLYDFLEAALDVESLWNILVSHMELIISDLVFQTLLLSESDVELLHHQPEEYILINIENAEFTPRNNACKFLSHMIKSHGNQILEGFFTFINQCISKHHENRDDYQLSIQKDAALQMICSVRFTLLNGDSPFLHQMESFIVQQVSVDTSSRHAFLRARACELIAEFGKIKYSMQDPKQLCSRIMDCLNDTEVVVRFQAIMALQTLVRYQSVCTALAQQISQVMHKILEIYDDVDSERISLVMEDLIDIFSEQLSPFSVQLSKQLSDQFTRIVTELLTRESQNAEEYGFVDDKNMAAFGILNALSTLLFSLEKSPALITKVEANLLPVLRIVLENSQEPFYQEVFELIDTCLYSVSQVTDTMFEVLEMIKVGFKVNPSHGAEYFIPCLCNFVKFSDIRKIMTENNIKFFFDMTLYYVGGQNISEEDKQQACNFAQVIIINYARELGPNNYVDYFVSQLLNCCAGDLTNTQSFSPAIHRRVLNVYITAIFYNPRGVTQFLEQCNYLGLLIEALVNHPEVFARPYEKKLVALGLVKLLAIKFSMTNEHPLVMALFKMVPLYTLSYQTQIEKETNDSGGGGGFAFVDETYSTEASFQQYGEYFFLFCFCAFPLC